MTADGYTAVPATWTSSGEGMIGASNKLATAVDTLCGELGEAGECWGNDDIGRSFFNGDDKTPGFGKARDTLLAELADMVNLVRATGGLLKISGHTYSVAEKASTIGSALPSGADKGALAAVDPYSLPKVAQGLAKSDPPPGGFEFVISLLRTLVFGCDWPDGSLEQLASMRDAFHKAAGTIDTVADDVSGHTETITANNEGETTQQFASFAAALQGGGDEGGLRWLAAACKSLGDSTDFLIKQKNAARLQFGLSIAFLAAVWAIALAVSWLTGGGSVGAATATTEAEGSALRLFLQRIAQSVVGRSLIVRGAAMGAVYSGGLDAVGQYARIHEGVQDGFSLTELAKAGGEGALAGGVMGGAGAWVAREGNGFTTALSSFMNHGGFKAGAAKVAFNGVAGTAGNLASQGVFDQHFDLKQAAEFGFGMAGIEGAKGAGRYAANRFGPSRNSTAGADPALPATTRTDNGGETTPAGHSGNDDGSGPPPPPSSGSRTTTHPGNDDGGGPPPPGGSDAPPAGNDTRLAGNDTPHSPAPTTDHGVPHAPDSAAGRPTPSPRSETEAAPVMMNTPGDRPTGPPTPETGRPSIADILSGKTSPTAPRPETGGRTPATEHPTPTTGRAPDRPTGPAPAPERPTPPRPENTPVTGHRPEGTPARGDNARPGEEGTHPVRDGVGPQVDKPAGDDGRIGTVIDRPNNHSATAQPPRDVVVAGVPHDQSGRAAPDSPADGPSVTPDPPRADTNAVSGERAEPAVTAPIRRVDQAAPGSPKTSTAVPEAARPAHPRELLAKQIAHLEQERVRLAMANEGERPSPAVLHHHDPDPRIAALDDAIMRKQAELNALGPPAEMVFTAGGGEALRVGPGDEVMLGRSHESPLSKARPDEYVSRRHAVLEVDRAGRAWIRDLGSTNGTYVNGERIEPHTKVPLEPGDRVRLGENYELSAAEHPPRQAEAEGHPPGAKEEAVSPPPEQTPAPRDPAGAVPAQPEAARPTDHAWVEAGDSSGNLRIPRGGEILIGRSTSSPMRAMLADLSDVSRRHATYGLDHDGTPWIRDEGSTNGTRVNGVEILPGEKVRLKAGDVVDFGADNKLRMKIPAAVRNTPVVPPHAPEAHAPAPAERAATPERPDAPASPPVEHPKPAAPPHAPEAHAPAPAERAATPEIRDALAPLLAEHPELTAAPHTVGELKDMLDGLHRDLPFKHIAALRELSYLEHGMEPPAISRERLDTFLDEVWNNRDHLRDGPMEIYRLYASATEPNPITRSPESYANSLVALADSRPPGAEAIIQRSWMDLRTLRDNGHLTLQMMNNGGFFHFRRMGADVNLVTERVYINARADHAPELMSAMVREVVDSPAEFPGVYAAKISSHRSVGNRPDNIVLYANDDAAAKKVIDWLAQYRERNPDAFMWSTPAMTEQVMEGVSRGAEPQVRGESFGTVRAKTIYNALFGKNMEGASRADLLRAALERFAKFGIDPEAPHQNLPRSTP